MAEEKIDTKKLIQTVMISVTIIALVALVAMIAVVSLGLNAHTATTTGSSSVAPLDDTVATNTAGAATGIEAAKLAELQKEQKE